MRGYFYSPGKSWLGRLCNRIKGHLATGPNGVQRNVFTEMREERELLFAFGNLDGRLRRGLGTLRRRLVCEN